MRWRGALGIHPWIAVKRAGAHGVSLIAFGPPRQHHLRALGVSAGPALRLDLAPTATGKDYLGSSTFIDHALSGTVWHLSMMMGLAGVTVARDGDLA